MKFYRYWLRCTRDITGKNGAQSVQSTVAYGYSDYSLEDARACGERLLDTVEKRIAGSHPEWHYATEERPIREKILLQLTPLDVVTRNRYGAEVLNSNRLVFIDIDGEIPSSQNFFAWLATLLSTKDVTSDAQQEPFDRIAQLAKKAGHEHTPIRIYRTRAGYRLLLDTPLEGKDCQKLMKCFHADPLYTTLCRSQNCYRARLTPKPYRIRIPKCRFDFPEDNPETLAFQQHWITQYNAHSEPFAVCHYLGTLNGAEGQSADVVVRYHDDRTHAFSNLPLA
ncbi:MAG: hypothetical protein J5654_00935 [Victivallales bacterium]|nr:hypothetical protein [Victivallales bacterium]